MQATGNANDCSQQWHDTAASASPAHNQDRWLFCGMRRPGNGAAGWVEQHGPHYTRQCAALPGIMTFRGVRPQIVLSIREPYEYYHSLYTYAYSGTGMPKTHLAFEDFMKTYVEKAAPTPKAHYRYSQATRITRVCGTPCNYDYLLRTESLTQDWAALLKAMRIPLREAAASLPRLNPTTTKRGGAKPVIFTRRVLDIIDRADGMLFDLFGYARRTQCRSTGPRASLETRIARIPF